MINAQVRTTSLSPNGRFLAVGSSLGVVTIWDTKDGELCVEEKVGTASINDICWHPKRAEIAVAGSDGTVSLWTFDRAFDNQEEARHPHAMIYFKRRKTMTGHRRQSFR
jgi:WD40 repeat protein